MKNLPVKASMRLDELRTLQKELQKELQKLVIS